MGQRIVQVDAFTDLPFRGNPAAVCLLTEPRSDAWMQCVAEEMNLAETAFLLPGALSIGATDEEATRGTDFQLRWFTPTIEVDLCGHATLASAHLLWEEGHVAPEKTVRFHTRSGLLQATHATSGEVELDFPTEPPIGVETDDLPVELLNGLGTAPLYVGKNRMDYLVEIESETDLRQLKPDIGLLARLPVRGIIVTALSDQGSRFDFVSRFFAPAAGVNEDPVTGSAHCCLGPYWQTRLNRSEFVAYQASRRGGTLHIRVAGDRILLSGRAVTTLRGELTDIASTVTA